MHCFFGFPVFDSITVSIDECWMRDQPLTFGLGGFVIHDVVACKVRRK